MKMQVSAYDRSKGSSVEYRLELSKAHLYAFFGTIVATTALICWAKKTK